MSSNFRQLEKDAIDNPEFSEGWDDYWNRILKNWPRSIQLRSMKMIFDHVNNLSNHDVTKFTEACTETDEGSYIFIWNGHVNILEIEILKNGLFEWLYADKHKTILARSPSGRSVFCEELTYIIQNSPIFKD